MGSSRPGGRHVLARLAGRSWRDKLLLAEALMALAGAAALIAFAPFSRVARIMDAAVRGSPPVGEARQALTGRVRWAVVAVAGRVPWRALCFEQGLAAHWMLRRRSVPTTLHYGVAGSVAAGLEGHVWVRDGDQPIVGCELAGRFTELAVFPDPSRARR